MRDSFSCHRNFSWGRILAHSLTTLLIRFHCCDHVRQHEMFLGSSLSIYSLRFAFLVFTHSGNLQHQNVTISQQIVLNKHFSHSFADFRPFRRWSLANNSIAVALHSTEALMAGFLKSSDLGPHPHSYGGPHHPHHSHGPPLPPGMPMTSLAPFGLAHGLDAVGFPHQGMWGKYWFQILVTHIYYFYCYYYEVGIPISYLYATESVIINPYDMSRWLRKMKTKKKRFPCLFN